MTMLKNLFETPRKTARTLVGAAALLALLTTGAACTNGPAQGKTIDVEKAKEIALTDAGVSASDVTFIRQEADTDDNRQVYEIEFYTATHEYDYDIDMKTGDVYSKDVDALPTKPTPTPAVQPAAQPTNNPANTPTNPSPAQQAQKTDYIGVDKAKSLAVAKAGFAINDVNFIKAELDRDDGLAVYEVEFYKDRVEYECTINAVNGDILEYDVDRED